MDSMLRVAQIRAYPEKGNLETNYQLLISALGDIETHHPDVLVTPECFLDGYVVTEPEVTAHNLVSYAVTLDSPYIRTISEWAQTNACWIVLGCSRLAPKGVYNSALIFDRQGQLAGSYDKIHCQTHDVKFCPGTHLDAFPSDFGPFGVMICADRRWPETVRTIALQGARIIFNPTYGMHDERNQHMMETRSYESEVFIVFTHPGQSLITGPRGRALCNEISPDTKFSITDLDLAQVDEVRSGPSAHLRDRRPELYRL